MAQTNYTPIQLYYSTTAAAVPLNTNLASGELAINITDGLLFYKDNGGTVQKIGYKLTPTTAGGTGLTSFTANGVVYASSTSALATNSALVFDGTSLGIGSSSALQLNSVGAARTIFTNTVDGTDNGYVIITPGSSATTARGGYFAVAGNENSTFGNGGNAVITAGNVSGAKVKLQFNETDVAVVSSTGLAVTGTLSATGIITGNNSIKSTTAAAGQPEFVLTQTSVASWSIYNPPSSTDLRFYNGADRLVLSATGLAVAGTLSATGLITASLSGLALTVPNGYQTLYRTTNDTSSLLHLQFFRGTGAGAYAGIFTTGDAANGVASLNLNIDGTNIAKVSSTGLAVTGTLTAGATGSISLYDANLRQTGASTALSIGTAGAGYIQFYNNDSNTMRLDSSGNLGIGTSSPSQKLVVRDVNKIVDGIGNVFFATTDSQAADLGASLSLGGTYVGTSAYSFAAIAGRKTNSTSSDASGYLAMYTTNPSNTIVERARIDSSGNLLVGTTSGTNHYIAKAVAQGSDILGVISSTTNLQTAYFMGVSSAGENAAASAIGVRKNSSTSRSINAAGTINASGADYAEYMTKAGDFTIAKGDVVGVDAQGKLTNVFADAVSFVVKSTDPSYVGGDVWGNEEALGLTRPTSESTQAEKDAFDFALEAARQRVDRIAFAGQVPVNVVGATAGQYIIPVNNNGAIKGEAVSNPIFEQYQISVGKVISIESDGRARIIVKVA